MVGAWGQDFWTYRWQFWKPRLLCSPERQESCAWSPRGVAAEDHGFLGFCWGRGGASTPGSWGRERSQKPHPEIHMCAKGGVGDVFFWFMHFAGVGDTEEQDAELLRAGWRGTCIPGTSGGDRMGFQCILRHGD